jgi:hypothetical protein
MVRKQCPVLELANQMSVRNMDLDRAPRRTARKKGSGYENGRGVVWGGGVTKTFGALPFGDPPQKQFSFSDLFRPQVFRIFLNI